ncbi:MAG: hypothetical protein JO332_18135, partial [Planctomycetaceae bacterium]|nr:hypothetical protein [Planctomycetaceae bacterium]
MIARRSFLGLLALAVLWLLLWTAYRGALACFLLNGRYALLERWGGERYFVPALRHFHAVPWRGIDSYEAIYDWVRHRMDGRFPDECIRNMSLRPSGELALLLRGTEEYEERTKDYDRCRVVVVDPVRSDVQTAASEVLRHNAWRMDWWGDWVLLDGGGTLTVSLALHREGSLLRLIPSRETGHDGPPYLWGAPRFEDLDGDGIPEVLTHGSAREPCP